MPKYLRWFCLAAAVIASTTRRKSRGAGVLAPGESRSLAPLFNLVLVFHTRGAAFSFLASAEGWQTLFFAAIAGRCSLWSSAF
jgi:signal peptidase II